MVAFVAGFVANFENRHFLVQLLLQGVQVLWHRFARLGLEPIIEEHGVLAYVATLFGLGEDTVAISDPLLLLPHLIRFAAALHQLERPAVHAHLSQVLLVVWVIQVVCLLVGVEVRLLVEALIASGVGATKGLLACVDAQVGLEVEVKAEFLEANVTLVRLFPCVHQHVALQLCVVQEALIAVSERALKLYRTLKNRFGNLRVCRHALSCVS